MKRLLIVHVAILLGCVNNSDTKDDKNLDVSLTSVKQVDDVALNLLAKGAKVVPVTDLRIKASIHAMADSGRTSVDSGPSLPPGYDYDNVVEVRIDDGSPGGRSLGDWTALVAYSNSANTETLKEMVGLYYDRDGNFVNFLYTDWRQHTIRAAPIDTSFKNIFPENCHSSPISYNSIGVHWITTSRVPEVTTARVRPVAECGQRVSSCIGGFYGGMGWLSVGLTLATFFQPEIGVGVIGGCMLGCALELNQRACS